ncbi:MAG TPA: DUF3040 domain-containing protein [Micromonosporaceae bacterium]|nr:DUF3040 domain-containing protein [Micromonosporaceae bacterium]
MLSAEERRRLDEIERLLQRSDPAFVVRMRTGRQPRRRKAVVSSAVLLLAVLAPVWLIGGWKAGLLMTVMVGLAALTVHAVRRRRSRQARPPTPPAPPWLQFPR